MNDINRRDWLMQVTALGVASSLAARPASAQAPPDTTKWFPGFKPVRVKTSGAEINGVIGGSGPPILLLHGAPQSHITWRLVAPKLAATRTVVVSDLRGYGGSDKPTNVRHRIQERIATGKALAEVKAAGVTRDYAGRYGATTGAWTPEQVIEAIYRELSKQ